MTAWTIMAEANLSGRRNSRVDGGPTTEPLELKIVLVAVTVTVKLSGLEVVVAGTETGTV
jgi:hypothetical protein